MKFSEFKYERPDMDLFSKAFKEEVERFKTGETLETQIEAMNKINQMRNTFDTMYNVASIRYTINTKDTFYENEQAYFDEEMPNFEGLVNLFYKELIGAKHRQALEEKFGQLVFKIAELKINTFKPEIVEDMQKENALSSQYTKLLASAQIEFDGKKNSIPQMSYYTNSIDRETRRKASLELTKFFEANEKEFDAIYDEMVAVRNRIAQKLGYENYVQLGYARLGRIDYTPEDVKVYRDAIYKHLVPYSLELRQAQARRLGLEGLKHYDNGVLFKSGNPKPVGSPEEIIENGKKMYKELSPETDAFFNFMVDNELMDLLSHDGKSPGGYCTYMPDYQSPFIFANFNDTLDDISVLTHEAGHAFQVYLSRGYSVPEYYWPTYEACEIHSMSMEFITMPWMEMFFGADNEKFKYYNVADAFLFIPYGITVDEFQHFVYENPEATPEMRKAKWREIEKKYLPFRNYEEDPFLEKGTFWYRQGHIFKDPFYYVDYTLAQICAFQFYKKTVENFDLAWKDYLNFCQLGGSDSFVNLVNRAHLKTPFADETIHGVVDFLKHQLEAIDDSQL